MPKQPSPSASPEKDNDDVELMRHFNHAAEGLNLLYEAAAAGSPGAKDLLRRLAHDLLVKGENWRRMKYSKK